MTDEPNPKDVPDEAVARARAATEELVHDMDGEGPFRVLDVTIGGRDVAIGGAAAFVKFDCDGDYEIGVRSSSIDAYRAQEQAEEGMGAQRHLTLYLRSGVNVYFLFVRDAKDEWTLWDRATEILFGDSGAGVETLP